MKTWDAWLPDVLVFAHTAPDPLVISAARTASREFFRRTRVWVEWLDPVPVASGGQFYAYDFDLPLESELVRVEQATADGNRIDVSSLRQLPADPSRQAHAGRAIVTGDVVGFQVLSGVGTGSSVQVLASLMPSLASRGVPDHLGARFHEAISHGIKAHVLKVPGEFMNADLAMLSRSEFEAAINAHAVEAFMGHTRQIPRLRPTWC